MTGDKKLQKPSERPGFTGFSEGFFARLSRLTNEI
jgi:hypothetical protein